MLEILRELLNNAYCPMSKRQVATVVKMKDGKMFKGINVENPSFKSGLCAEQVAIGAAISEGYKKGDFEAIYIMDNSGEFINPCFLCRQNFVEFFTDTKIILMNLDGSVQEYDFKEFCPHPFLMEVNHD